MVRNKFFPLAAIMLFALLPLALEAAEPITHVLQKGETLYAISRKYEVPYEALASANSITDPTKVKIGTVLVIPSVHLVTKGETLYGIAREYGTTVSALLSSNKLSSGYVLKIGDILVVPGTQEKGAAIPPAKPSSASASASTSIPVSASIPVSTTVTAPAVSIAPAPVHAAPAPSPVIAPAPSSTVGASAVVSPATSSYAPMPTAMRTQEKIVDMKLAWPASGKAYYLDGKLDGVMIRVKPGDSAKAVAAGTVVSAGPSRGFGQVAFVQSKAGYVYVYGGNESLFVKTGENIASGKEIGKIGLDAKDGTPVAYFFVFRNGQSMDPALAPRD
ncbi:MAG: LysM peptidoglycan-binding domain-containing protein [Rectinemataceae bacterium]